jgi:hypothetical protein
LHQSAPTIGKEVLSPNLLPPINYIMLQFPGPAGPPAPSPPTPEKSGSLHGTRQNSEISK